MARKKRHPPAPAGALPPTGSPGAAASTPAPVAGAAQAADGLGTPESARPRPSLPPEAGGKDATRRATEIWKRLLEQYVPPPLDPAVKERLTAEGCGHYGIFSGRRWREVIHPRLHAFIRKHHETEQERGR